MTLPPRRELLAGLLLASGLVHLAGLLGRWFGRRTPLVLMGHRVLPAPAANAVDAMALISGHAITPAELERRLLFLKRWVMAPGMLAPLLAPASRSAALPSERRFFITFDDGYKDNVDHAAPVLRRLGLEATIFVVTDLVRHPAAQPWWDRWGAEALQQRANDPQAAALDYGRRCAQAKQVSTGLTANDLQAGDTRRYLNTGELAALREPFYVANHTASHANLTQLSSAECREHILRGDELISGHPRRLPWLAFPFGARSAQILAQLRSEPAVALALATGGGIEGDRLQAKRLNLNTLSFALFAASAVGLIG